MHRLYGPSAEAPEPLEPVPDLAGTPVDDVDGRFTGVLHGSLAEAESGLIRYLDVELEHTRRHVLVPLAHARVEREFAGRPRVRLVGASREELKEVPTFHADGPPVGHEVGRTVTRAHGRLYHGERYYAHPAYDHRGLYAGEHPIVSGPTPRPGAGPLERLSELPDYRVAGGEEDIRGWPLEVGHHRVGTIEDLVVDPDAGKVRYAIVALFDADRRVLVPVGYLRIREKAEIVEAPALVEGDVRALPEYDGGPITRAMEKHARNVLDERLDGDGRHFHRPDYAPAGDGGRVSRGASE